MCMTTTDWHSYPWIGENQTKQYTFYMVVLKSWPDTLNVGTETFLTAIQFAFTTNKWGFDKFLQVYKNYIDISEYEIKELKGYTWYDFCEFAHIHYSKFIGGKDTYQQYYIDITKLETIEQYLPVTGEMFSKVEEDEYTSSVESLAIPLLVEAKLWLDVMSKKGYVKDSIETRLIRRMLDKIVNIYITLYLRCINFEYSDHADMGEWFLSLPDDVKIKLTMQANFPKPIESIEWIDLLTEDFNLMMWLEDIVGYPNPVDTEEKHSTFSRVEVDPKRRNDYANMITNYSNGWGYLTS